MTMKKVIINHPVGNANVRSAVYGLDDRKLLKAFYTSIACFPGTLLYAVGSLPIFKEVRKRVFLCQIENKTRVYPWIELGRMLSIKLGLKSFVKHEFGLFSVDQVYRTLDNYVSKRLSDCDAVYCYEDGALASFERAKTMAVCCLYDLPIGYWRAARTLMRIEIEKNPAWASTLNIFKDSNDKLDRKDRELALADHIFVASTFTANTLKACPIPLKEISVIPYGFPPVVEKRVYTTKNGQPLRVLFVGGLSQRKGIAYLFDAVQRLGNLVTLTVVGTKPNDDCEVLNKALSTCRYIERLPHEKILEEMRNHDVFVFPSLFEGFGLVITEAMSQGTPVITTDRTAGPDIITHNVDGWIVEAGCANALYNQMKVIADNPDIIEKVGRAALETARKRPWSVYSEALSHRIQEVVTKEKSWQKY